MGMPLFIQIIRDPSYTPGENLQVEVNGELQPDLVPYWAAGRQRAGFGYDDTERSAFGTATTPPFGDGVFGYAGFEDETAVLEHRTVKAFRAGNYAVRIRGRDMLDNVGEWSEPATIYHRPPPPAVNRLRLDGSNIRFDYPTQEVQ